MSALFSSALGRDIGSIIVTPVSGGDINRSYRLESGGESFFIKVNSLDRLYMFEAEAKGLEAIRQAAAIRVPEVISTGAYNEESYLLLEYIEFQASTNTSGLAQHLAALHHYQSPRFGFDTDNTIGLTPQINQYRSTWLEFWKENRLQFQLELCQNNGFKTELIDCGYRLVDQCSALFGSYQPTASLLHGDLWSGNWQYDNTGNPVIYDPACYYGDHEVDLAMLELFGSPGQDFYTEYGEYFPIDSGYSVRRDLYNLYHLLNHANMFGGSYPVQAYKMIKKLLAVCS